MTSTNDKAPKPTPAIEPQESKLSPEEVVALNRKYWDERAPIHAASNFYDVRSVVTEGRITLRDFEVEELGPLAGKDVLHLQCHIGTDSISLARLGANVTGVDFSSAALAEARKLADQTNAKATFIHSTVEDATRNLEGRTFDIVYVNIGSIRWHPNLTTWAAAVSTALKPGGFLYLFEIHPVSIPLAPEEPRFKYDYFNEQGKLWDEPGSYTDGAGSRDDKTTQNNQEVGWDRTLGTIVTTIAEQGLVISHLKERPGHEDKQYPYLEQGADGLWYPPEGIMRVPATFTLKAFKPSGRDDDGSR